MMNQEKMFRENIDIDELLYEVKCHRIFLEGFDYYYKNHIKFLDMVSNFDIDNQVKVWKKRVEYAVIHFNQIISSNDRNINKQGIIVEHIDVDIDGMANDIDVISTEYYSIFDALMRVIAQLDIASKIVSFSGFNLIYQELEEYINNECKLSINGSKFVLLEVKRTLIN